MDCGRGTPPLRFEGGAGFEIGEDAETNTRPFQKVFAELFAKSDLRILSKATFASVPLHAVDGDNGEMRAVYGVDNGGHGAN